MSAFFCFPGLFFCFGPSVSSLDCDGRAVDPSNLASFSEVRQRVCLGGLKLAGGVKSMIKVMGSRETERRGRNATSLHRDLLVEEVRQEDVR